MTQLGLVNEGPVLSADSKEFSIRGAVPLKASLEMREWYSALSSVRVFFGSGVGANMGQDRQRILMHNQSSSRDAKYGSVEPIDWHQRIGGENLGCAEGGLYSGVVGWCAGSTKCRVTEYQCPVRVLCTLQVVVNSNRLVTIAGNGGLKSDCVAKETTGETRRQ